MGPAAAWRVRPRGERLPLDFVGPPGQFHDRNGLRVALVTDSPAKSGSGWFAENRPSPRRLGGRGHHTWDGWSECDRAHNRNVANDIDSYQTGKCEAVARNVLAGTYSVIRSDQWLIAEVQTKVLSGDR